jgi:hypothetical protein
MLQSRPDKIEPHSHIEHNRKAHIVLFYVKSYISVWFKNCVLTYMHPKGVIFVFYACPNYVPSLRKLGNPERSELNLVY